MKRLAYLAMALAVAAVFCGAAAAALPDCMDATARVSVQNGRDTEIGTAVAFASGNGYVYCLTNHHVVAAGTDPACEFIHAGHKSNPLPAVLVKSNPEMDTAILAIPHAEFGTCLPAVIPLAPRGLQLYQGQQVYSIGAANGAWPTMFSGHILGPEEGQLAFVPAPANGRSGSALFDASGSYIVGIVRARYGESNDPNVRGWAVTLDSAYTSVYECSMLLADRPRLTQCGPAQCGPGGCFGSGNTPEYDDGLRNRRRQQQASPVAPYPTLPAAPAPAVDPSQITGPIVGALNQLAQAMPQGAVQPSGPDPACMQAVQALGGTVAQQGQAIGQLQSGLSDVAKATKEVSDNVKAHGTFLERFAADKQTEAAKNPGESKVQQDIGALKDMAVGNGHAFVILVVLLVAIPGTLIVCGIAVFLVMHLISQFRQVADKNAAANPNDPVLQAVAKIADAQDNLNQTVAAPLNTLLGSLPLPIPGLAPVAGAAGLASAVANLQSQVASHATQLAGQAQTLANVALATPAPSQTAAAGTATPTTLNVNVPAAAAPVAPASH